MTELPPPRPGTALRILATSDLGAAACCGAELGRAGFVATAQGEPADTSLG